MLTYTEREKELIRYGYDPCHAAQIAQDEAGAKQFSDDMRKGSRSRTNKSGHNDNDD
jgi:hypothetical protein